MHVNTAKRLQFDKGRLHELPSTAMVPREDRLFALAVVLAASACVAEGVMDLTCKIKKRQSAPMLGLSSNAMNSIYYKGSQTSSSFQVLDCTCEGNEDEVNVEWDREESMIIPYVILIASFEFRIFSSPTETQTSWKMTKNL